MKQGHKRINLKSVLTVLAVFTVAVGLFGSAFTFAASDNTKGSTIYTTDVKTTIYKKDASNSAKREVWYNTKMTLLSKRSSPTGTWNKVKYRGSIYYIWTAKGQTKFSTTNKIKSTKKYLSYCKTDLQKEVITEALRIYNKWNTAYDFKQKYSDGKKRNGVYSFHCSGYAAYVINKVMQKYATPYYVSSDPEKLAATGYILNEKIDGQVKAKTICKGKLDYTKLQPGDVLFFKVMANDPRPIDHVGIYIGNRQFLNSTRYLKGTWTNKGYDKDGGVCIAPLTGMYKTGFIKAVRVLPTKIEPANITKTVTAVSGVCSDVNCEKQNGDQVRPGDKVTILYTYRTITGKHDAYISYGDGKKGYMYLFESKLK